MNNKKLFVGSLAWAMTDTELSEAFAAFGTVESAVVIMDKFSGRSKGFGFVEMSSDEEAQAAIDGLDGQDVMGRPIVVNVAKPREERPPRDGGFNRY